MWHTYCWAHSEAPKSHFCVLGSKKGLVSFKSQVRFEYRWQPAGPTNLSLLHQARFCDSHGAPEALMREAFTCVMDPSLLLLPLEIFFFKQLGKEPSASYI